jgi:hypothetical protein
VDWLSDYLIRIPEKTANIQNVSSLLPGSFDGPETHLRKLKLLSSVLKNKKGNLFVTSECNDWPSTKNKLHLSNHLLL